MPARKLVYYLKILRGISTRQWYWHITAPNGKIIADGAEGYEKKSGAVRAAKRFILVTQSGSLVLAED